MDDKFHMTRAQNVFLAKRILVDSVYKSANLEGIAVTYADTIDILNNVNVARLTPDEITAVINLRSAWRFTKAERARSSLSSFWTAALTALTLRLTAAPNRRQKKRMSLDPVAAL